MRFLLVISIWVVLIGGLTLFMATRRTILVPNSIGFEKAVGEFTMLIATTFDAEPDPFGLEPIGRSNSLYVKLNGNVVFSTSDVVKKGKPLSIPIDGLVKGKNEFFVAISPQLDEANLHQAALVKIMWNGRQLSERTFWTEDGNRIAGTIALDTSEISEGNDAQQQ